MASTVSDNQGSHKGSVRRGLFGRRTTQVTAPRKRVNGDTFFGVEGVAFEPDEQATQVLTAVREFAQTPVHRDHDTDPDRVALNIIDISAIAVRDKWSSTRYEDTLLVHLGELRRRAGREQEAGQALLRRPANAAQVAERVADVIETAVENAAELERLTGAKVDPNVDTDALGTGIAAFTANAHAVDDETLHAMPAITKGMPDPRLTKPVDEVEVTQVIAMPHPWDGAGLRSDGSLPHPEVTEPASPAHPAEKSAPVPVKADADPAPLPKRVKPVHWISAADHPDVLGKSVDPAKTEIAAGDWVRDEGSDCSGGPAWGVVAEVKLGKEFTRITFASGLPVKVYAGRTVRMLTSSEAKSLLTEARSGWTA